MIEAVDSVKAFLRCGGMLLWNQWEEMPAETKALFIEAGEQLEVERITQLAIAVRDEHGAAALFARVDGGDALVRRGMLDAVGKFVAKGESA